MVARSTTPRMEPKVQSRISRCGAGVAIDLKRLGIPRSGYSTLELLNACPLNEFFPTGLNDLNALNPCLMEIPCAAAFRLGRRQIMAHGIEMRMDFQRPAEAHRRLTKLVQRHVAKPLA